MRKNSKFLKSNKLSRFLVIFLLFSVLLTIILIPFNPQRDIGVNVTCKKNKVTEKYCVFNCTVISDGDSIGRIIVTHTVWASIFDKEFEIKKNQPAFIEIKIPKRIYIYYLRAGFYNEKHYGTLEDELRC